MDMAKTLKAAGYLIAGPASSVRRALRLIAETPLNGALLDINLGKDTVWPVAEALDECGVPFLLASGYSPVEIPKRFKDRLLLRKPVAPAELAAALRAVGVLPAETAP